MLVLANLLNVALSQVAMKIIKTETEVNMIVNRASVATAITYQLFNMSMADVMSREDNYRIRMVSFCIGFTPILFLAKELRSNQKQNDI